MKILLILIVIIVIAFFFLNNQFEEFISDFSLDDNIYFEDNELYQKYNNVEYSRINLKTKEVKHWYAKQIVDKISKNKKNKKVLVLGVALGGLIIDLLNRHKHMHITGLDIEDTHFNLVKKYSDNKRLTLIKQDAKEYVSKMKEKFDIIIVDIFIGDKVPEFVLDNNNFLNKLQKNLNYQGIFMINTIGINKIKLKNIIKKAFYDSEISVINEGGNYLGIALK